MGRLFTKAQKAQIHAQQGGLCAIEGCDAAIEHYDHILPWGLGGQTVVSNGRGLCIECHKPKTRADVGRIAKAKRQSKCVGPRAPPKRPIRGRSKWPKGRKLRSLNTLGKRDKSPQ